MLCFKRTHRIDNGVSPLSYPYGSDRRPAPPLQLSYRKQYHRTRGPSVTAVYTQSTYPRSTMTHSTTTISNRLFRLSHTLLLAASLAACGDNDLRTPVADENIEFAVTASNDWSLAESRSRQSDGTASPRHKIYVMEGRSSALSRPVYLHTTEDDWTDTVLQSRATITGEAAGLKSIAMTAYVSQNGSERRLYSDQERLSASSGWRSSRFWPADNSEMDFYAYGFTGDRDKPDNMTFRAGTPAAPVIAFSTLAADDRTETGADLLVGKSEGVSSSSKPVVEMTMRHALTKIEFDASANFAAGTITAIGFRGVRASAVYDYAAEEWQLPRDNAAAAGFRREFADGIATDGQTKVPVVAGDDAFLMMPQTLGSEAELYVEFTEAVTGLEIELTFPLTGYQWGKGKRLRYVISTNPDMIQPFLEIDRKEFRFDYRGMAIVDSTYNSGTRQWDYKYADRHEATLKSYYAITSANNATKYAPLELDIEDILNSQSEDWYTMDIERLPSVANMAEYKVTLKCEAQEGIEEGSGEILSKTPLGTEAEPYDLSTMGGTEARTTANCYIVNAPGWYSFPLVYGNAIKNNNNNSLSYERTESYGGNSLDKLLNYLGNPISHPYIYEDCKMDNAKGVLIWQDGVNLTDEYYIDQEKKNFIFHISGSSQGNLVLGIKDTKRNWIMWNWHIWLTDYSSDGDFTISSSNPLTFGLDNVGSDYVFMSKNIGWCDGYSIVYEGRTANIEFIQIDQNKARGILLNVDQVKHTDVSIGNNTLYQWGRKDPIPGITIDEYGVAKLKSINSNEYYMEFKTADDPTINDNTIQAAIRFPMRFYFFINNSWTYEEIPCNLWAINQANYTGTHNLYPCIKTIYDPSPRGYKIPDNRVFHHLFYTQSQYTWVISSEEAHPNGFESFSVPLSGIIDDVTAKPILYWKDPNDNITKRIGRFWTARSQSTNAGSHVCVKYWDGGSWINFHSEGCSMCSGMSIRPMKDD